MPPPDRARPAPAPGALSRFADDFAHALLAADMAPRASGHIEALVRQPAFAVYRNTVQKGCIDALQSTYPAVTRLVGEAWFRAAALVYVRQHPPAAPVLLGYGANFPDFVAGFEPARELTYLPAVARLDRLWIEAHSAADEPVARPGILLATSGDALDALVLRPHAAARWAWFEDAPALTIWRANRDEAHPGAAIAWRSEGVLLTRPRHDVRSTELAAAGIALLDACAAGSPLTAACAQTLSRYPGTDLTALLADLLVAGAFADPLVPPDSAKETVA